MLVAFAAAIAAWAFGCGDDIPTDLGGGLRTPPDSLVLVELRGIMVDSTYAVPVSLARATTGQLGRRAPYTAHVLYDFRIPTRSVVGGDTFHLDTANLVIKTDSILTQPFTGTMQIGLAQVDTAGRFWSRDTALDSAIVQLPPLIPGALARDTLLAGAATVNSRVTLSLGIDLQQIVGYDSVRAEGGTLEVNVALLFEAFSAGGKGFLPLVFDDRLIGFSNDDTDAIANVTPAHRRVIAEIDSSYSPGTNLAVSDGFRLHSFIKFDAVRTVLPESALVFQAEFVLTIADTSSADSFDDLRDDRLGVIVPRDTLVFSRATNIAQASFSAPLVATPLSTVTIPVTPYLFDQQEAKIPNRGIILALSAEGTRIRHFEFFGAGGPPERRPFIRLVYGFPAPFEGGGR